MWLGHHLLLVLRRRKRIAKSRIRDERLIGKRSQKLGECYFLDFGQRQTVVGKVLQSRVKITVRFDTPVVMLDHLVERVKTSIVHVRSGQFDIAKRRGFEASPIIWISRHFSNSTVHRRNIAVDSIDDRFEKMKKS